MTSEEVYDAIKSAQDSTVGTPATIPVGKVCSLVCQLWATKLDLTATRDRLIRSLSNAEERVALLEEHVDLCDHCDEPMESCECDRCEICGESDCDCDEVEDCPRCPGCDDFVLKDGAFCESCQEAEERQGKLFDEVVR